MLNWHDPDTQKYIKTMIIKSKKATDGYDNLPDYIKNDVKFARLAFKWKATIYPSLPDELKQDKKILLEAIRRWRGSFPYQSHIIPNFLISNMDVIKAFIKKFKNGYSIYMPELYDQVYKDIKLMMLLHTYDVINYINMHYSHTVIDERELYKHHSVTNPKLALAAYLNIRHGHNVYSLTTFYDAYKKYKEHKEHNT